MIQNLSIQVLPVNEADAYAHIDRAIEVIKSSRLNYTVTAFATLVEGDLSALQRLITDIQDMLFANGLEEVVLNVQFHAKRSEDVFLSDKTKKHKG
ncbi:MAG: MTH1187 family thiamine-binding protein [Flavobacteriales bacterium]